MEWELPDPLTDEDRDRMKYGPDITGFELPDPPPAEELPVRQKTSVMDPQEPYSAKDMFSSMMSGLTGNWEDELGVVLGLMTPEEQDAYRVRKRFVNEEYPVSAISAEMIGGLAPGLGYAKLAGRMGTPLKALSFGKSLKDAALAGSLYGGLSGMGRADTEDILDRMTHGAVDAAFGSVTAPALMIGAKGVNRAVNSIGALLGIGKDFRAMSMLSRAMKDEGLDPELLSRELRERSAATGKPLALIDLVDPNKHPATYDIMRRSLIKGDPEYSRPAMTSLLNRSNRETTGKRLLDDIRTSVDEAGSKGELYSNIKKSRLERGEEYRAAFENIKGDVVDSPKIREILDRPFAKETIQKAMRAAADEGLPESRLFKEYLDIDSKNNLVWKKKPTIELIQAIKNLGYNKELNAVYEGRIKDVNYPSVSSIMKQRRDLMDEVKNIHGDYADMTARYKDASDLLSARELGAQYRGTFNKLGTKDDLKFKGAKTEELKDIIKSYSDEEKDAFMEGLAQSMRQDLMQKSSSDTSPLYAAIVGKDPSNPLSLMVSNIRDVFDDKDLFARFISKLKDEKVIDETTRSILGKTLDTSSFDTQAAKEFGDIVRLGMTTASGSPLGTGYGLSQMLKNIYIGENPRTLGPIGALAATPGHLSDLTPLETLLQQRYEPKPSPLNRMFSNLGLSMGMVIPEELRSRVFSKQPE